MTTSTLFWLPLGLTRILCGPPSLSIVSLHVFGEMITPHEHTATGRARVFFCSCMGLQVSLQLVTPSESLATEQPVADKGTITTMPA